MSENDSFVLLMACGGMSSQKMSKFKTFFYFVLLHFIFKCYYCSINLKRQSEHSEFCPDTSSLVCPCSQMHRSFICYCSLQTEVENLEVVIQ